MLNLTSIVGAFAQRDNPAPSSGRTALQRDRDEQLPQLSVVKRLFDVLTAAAALLVLAPVLAALAVVVRLTIGRPTLFKQRRPGLHGHPFVIYKFRTMSNARNAAGRLLPDAERLGRFGRFLRSTSLDELPELINVLRGEMSIVGPRPLLIEYLPHYSAEQRRRHNMLPGITGLAQINGRNAASWPRKFELDVWYVDHRSMWLDLQIIARTVWKVLKREDINQSDRVTSELFMGNAELAIRDFALAETVPPPVVRPGTALRHWEETYLDAAGQPEIRHQVRCAPRMRVLQTAQADEWMNVLRRMVRHDFYFLPGYHALAEKRGEGEARLFVYEQASYVIALPLIIRTLADYPAIGAAANTLRDATSVYGYSGPLCSHEDIPPTVVGGFQRALSAALQELQVVSVFSRLHPLLPAQTMLLDGLGDHQFGGGTVSINLSAAPADQRAHYHRTFRNRINRLVRSGVTCALDIEQRHLPEFVALYHETMHRVKAEQSYFFDATYFTALAESLGPVLKLFVAKMPGGEVIGGGLFTMCDGIVQYHLGAAGDAALKLSPMILVFETVRQWANEAGARIFHLGGGVRAKSDSLFQFKARFSRQRHRFVTWRWIAAPEAYRELSLQKHLWNSERGLSAISPSFFPAYRCPAEPEAVSGALRGSTSNSAATEELLPAQNG